MSTFSPFLSLTYVLGLVFLFCPAHSDPDPLQDYCIADAKASQSTFFNGIPCINPNFAAPSHFTTSVLSRPGNTRNLFGFNVTATNSQNLPGLNTLGLTMARIDIRPKGIVPLHSHPRASEVAVCLMGQILVGFIDTSNRLFSKKIGPGEAFVFPKGLVHFLYNEDFKSPAVALSGLSSQNPGAQIMALAAFTSKPDIPKDVLTKSFEINQCEIARIRRSLGG